MILGPYSVRHAFSIGTSNLSLSALQHLEEEQQLYGDLLLLDRLVDSYANLTRKTLWSIDAICKTYNFDFLLKVTLYTYIFFFYIYFFFFYIFGTEAKSVWNNGDDLICLGRLGFICGPWGVFAKFTNYRTSSFVLGLSGWQSKAPQEGSVGGKRLGALWQVFAVPS